MTTSTTILESTRADTRETRGLRLAQERFEEIALSHRGGCYTVPSLHGEHAYSVTYSAREESCSCPDWEFSATPAITSWLRPSSEPRLASALAAGAASGIVASSSSPKTTTTT
jgi:hypothetical protein